MRQAVEPIFSHLSRRLSSRRHHIAAWMRAPMKMGALLPSSNALARALASEVDVERPGAVIELGPGTGVVTHALLAAGIKPENLVIIERDPALHALMHAQLPHLHVIRADAAELENVLKELKITKVNAIVSSLPLLSMPKAVRRAIEQQMASAIGEKGSIIQFTYGPKSPLMSDALRRYKLVGHRAKFVLTNVPPAHVWVYKHGH